MPKKKKNQPQQQLLMPLNYDVVQPTHGYSRPFVRIMQVPGERYKTGKEGKGGEKAKFLRAVIYFISKII